MQNIDLLMIGSGPANLSIAVALEEHASTSAIDSSIMLEKETCVSWQKGMLFPEAQSQVSFLKDLVTLRDPTSRFSFLNFLHKTGKLEGFINLQTFNPYRREISDYLQWIADNLTKTRIRYGSNVTRVQPELTDDGEICAWLVSTEKGEEYRAKKLVFGAGRDINIPEAFKKLGQDRVTHSSNYLTSLEGIDKARVNNIAVIGGAQSSVEIYQSCLEHFPHARVKMIMRSIGLVNYEGSKFTNTLFSNDHISTFFNVDTTSRAQVLAEMHSTNYSGVAPATLDTLYRYHYLQELNGCNRAAIYTQCNIQSAHDDGSGTVVTWFDKKQNKTETEKFDLVFLGTGYQNKIPAIFNESMLMMDRTSLNVNRHYRADLPYTGGASLHLQGVNESTHGIADSLLSVLAQRSQEIVNDLHA